MYLKFDDEYVEPIAEHEKRTTWRINGRKDVVPGTPINLISDSHGNFGTAEVVWVKHTTIQALSDEDEKWHEKYDNTEERVEAMSEIYSNEVILPTTEVTVIRFETIDTIFW